MKVCDHCKDENGVKRFEVNLSMTVESDAIAFGMIRCELCEECKSELAEAMSLEFCRFFGGRDNINFFCDGDRATYGGEWKHIPAIQEMARSITLLDSVSGDLQ